MVGASKTPSVTVASLTSRQDWHDTQVTPYVFSDLNKKIHLQTAQMYAEWAGKTWDWLWDIKLIDNENYNVYDGSEADVLNCAEWDRNQWSYNPAVLLYGAAAMYNFVRHPT